METHQGRYELCSLTDGKHRKADRTVTVHHCINRRKVVETQHIANSKRYRNGTKRRAKWWTEPIHYSKKTEGEMKYSRQAESRYHSSGSPSTGFQTCEPLEAFEHNDLTPEIWIKCHVER